MEICLFPFQGCSSSSRSTLSRDSYLDWIALRISDLAWNFSRNWSIFSRQLDAAFETLGVILLKGVVLSRLGMIVSITTMDPLNARKKGDGGWRGDANHVMVIGGRHQLSASLSADISCLHLYASLDMFKENYFRSMPIIKRC
jgi:hypothetical protein